MADPAQPGRLGAALHLGWGMFKCKSPSLGGQVPAPGQNSPNASHPNVFPSWDLAYTKGKVL